MHAANIVIGSFLLFAVLIHLLAKIYSDKAEKKDQERQSRTGESLYCPDWQYDDAKDQK